MTPAYVDAMRVIYYFEMIPLLNGEELNAESAKRIYREWAEIPGNQERLLEIIRATIPVEDFETLLSVYRSIDRSPDWDSQTMFKKIMERIKAGEKGN